MTMNLKSSTLITIVALISIIFFVGELDARGRLGGGGGGLRGGGGLGGGGFSRGGVARGGGFSGHSGQRAGRQANRKDTFGDRGTGDRRNALKDRQSDRQDRGDESREDRQDAMKDRQEDRQDFIEDELDDDWDGRWDDNDGKFLAGAIVGGAIGAAAATDHTVVTTLPCTTTAVIYSNVSYYNCSSVWYERVYSGGSVTYIVTSAPPGY